MTCLGTSFVFMANFLLAIPPITLLIFCCLNITFHSILLILYFKYSTMVEGVDLLHGIPFPVRYIKLYLYFEVKVLGLQHRYRLIYLANHYIKIN